MKTSRQIEPNRNSSHACTVESKFFARNNFGVMCHTYSRCRQAALSFGERERLP